MVSRLIDVRDAELNGSFTHGPASKVHVQSWEVYDSSPWRDVGDGNMPAATEYHGEFGRSLAKIGNVSPGDE